MWSIRKRRDLEALLDSMRGQFGAPTRQGYPADVVAAQASSFAGPTAEDFTRLAEDTPAEISHKLRRVRMAHRNEHDPFAILRLGKEIDRLKKLDDFGAPAVVRASLGIWGYILYVQV